MHEMALAEGILQVVLDVAGNERVRSVKLHIGRLQMVVPDSLEFSFKLLSADTPAEAAMLEMQETPARLQCGKCGLESELDLPPFNCRHCGAADIVVISGDEVLVDAVELVSGETIRRRTVPANEILEEHLKEHAAHSQNGH